MPLWFPFGTQFNFQNTPLCGMPITMLLHSRSVMLSIMAFMPGMSVSQPSRPKRLAAVYLRGGGGVEQHMCEWVNWRQDSEC
jgi:hypothetical protein